MSGPTIRTATASTSTVHCGPSHLRLPPVVSLGPRFVAADTSFLVRYTDPDCTMMMDATIDPPVMTMNPDPGTGTEITLEMAADDGHSFWKGEMNMALALAKGKVKVSVSLFGRPTSVELDYLQLRAY